MGTAADKVAVSDFLEPVVGPEIEHLPDSVSQIEGDAPENGVVCFPVLGSSDRPVRPL